MEDLEGNHLTRQKENDFLRKGKVSRSQEDDAT